MIRSRNKHKQSQSDASRCAASSLHALVRQMNEEVKLSEQTTRILTSSSGTLRTANAELGSIDATIRSGGKLLSKFTRRETTDKILLILALIFYFVVILYILKKRTLFSVTDFLTM